MQRSRSETLFNAFVLSLALVVSYVAPRLASPPEERHVAAPARSINLRALERSIALGEDDDDDDTVELDEGGFAGEAADELRGLRKHGGKHARGVRVLVR